MNYNYQTTVDEAIDRYLLKEMSQDEKDAFEERLLAEPGLVEELQMRCDIIVGIRVSERRAITERLSKVNDNQGFWHYWQAFIVFIKNMLGIKK